jgi:hypothetical protein
VDRRNHYEIAFEAFLRELRLPYVAVDESKKALFSGSKLKSFDFVVYARGGPNLLVDVKGRKALSEAGRGGGAGGGGGPLQTWCSRQDVDDLSQWERIFGEGFKAIFGFVFEVDPVLAPPPGHFVFREGEQTHPAAGRERHYLMLGVDLGDYRNHMSRRSVRWDTVAMPSAEFRKLARPMRDWLEPGTVMAGQPV